MGVVARAARWRRRGASSSEGRTRDAPRRRSIPLEPRVRWRALDPPLTRSTGLLARRSRDEPVERRSHHLWAPGRAERRSGEVPRQKPRTGLLERTVRFRREVVSACSGSATVHRSARAHPSSVTQVAWPPRGLQAPSDPFAVHGLLATVEAQQSGPPDPLDVRPCWYPASPSISAWTWPGELEAHVIGSGSRRASAPLRSARTRLRASG